jgi:hypothetical protein
MWSPQQHIYTVMESLQMPRAAMRARYAHATNERGPAAPRRESATACSSGIGVLGSKKGTSALNWVPLNVIAARWRLSMRNGYLWLLVWIVTLTDHVLC